MEEVIQRRVLHALDEMQRANRLEASARGYTLPHRQGTIAPGYTVRAVVWNQVRTQYPTLSREDVSQLTDWRIAQGSHAYRGDAKSMTKTTPFLRSVAAQRRQLRRASRVR